MPNSHQFYSFTKEKMGVSNDRSIAWNTVRNLFETAETLYKTLDFYTSDRLSVFVDAKKYLTPTQEHDLVSLTASYIASLETESIYQIIEQDLSISEEERVFLKAALKLFQDTAKTTHHALGAPRWIND